MGPIFLVLVIVAVLTSMAFGADGIDKAILDSAKSAAQLAIGLIGYMALFLGMAQVLRRAGAMPMIARLLQPLFRRLFPDVPAGHPALGSMTLNMAANMLGLGNAATPLGIQAIEELDELNGRKGTATNAMCLFLAINTSSIALIPSGVFSMRNEVGSADPTGIWLPTLMATTVSTIVGITTCLLLARLPFFSRSCPPVVRPKKVEARQWVDPEQASEARWHALRLSVSLALVALGIVLMGMRLLGADSGADPWKEIQPLMLAWLIFIPALVGWSRGLSVYEEWVEGAKQGFEIAVRIIPFLVVVLTAIGMFRHSGALGALTTAVSPVLTFLGFPPEALPMALIRPLSGSGALGVMVETMQHYGPDSFVGYLVSTINGSTETTFYVLAVYGGAVAMRRTRHAVIACLAADFAGVAAATFFCRWFFL